MKKLALLAALLVMAALTVPSPPVDAAAAVCDPTRSPLCKGLVDTWEFTEGANASAYFGSFANSMLLKGDGAAAGTGGNKVGGGASVALGSAATSRLWVPRSGGFTGGAWTAASWIYTTTTGYNGGAETFLWGSLKYGIYEGSLVRIGTTAAGYKVDFTGWYHESGANPPTAFTVQHPTAITKDAWHLLVVTMSPYGDFGKDQVCISLDGGAFTCGSYSYPLIGSAQDMWLGAETVANPVYFDGFALWGRTFNDTDVAALYNSGTGRAFPFY